MAQSNPSSDFDRGRRVGKYELLTRLSMGGMAELFLAFLPGPGGFKKFVALKQILPDIRRDESFVKMFLDEARITAAFTHSNIAQVFDLGEDEQSRELYLAMEFVSGQNLEQLLKRASKQQYPVPVAFAARVIRDACLGLHYAHHFIEPSTGEALPVVHRDVSPKNVMITYTGNVKMIDFGIAKARGRLNRTQVGIVRGTSGYMSPEQVRNEPLDGRTDLFAAAAMLHEMLVGERLFNASNETAMMIKIVEGQVSEPAKVNPFVSKALSDVVMKGLAKKREERWSTGKEFARAIEFACPDLFEEEQVAEVMSQLFSDKIALTRSILDLANKGQANDANLSKAVETLQLDEAESKTQPGAMPSATPRGQPALATPRSGTSSSGLPKANSERKATGSKSGVPAATPSSKSSQKVPKLTGETRKAKAPEADLDATLPANSPSPFRSSGSSGNLRKVKTTEPKPVEAPPPAEPPIAQRTTDPAVPAFVPEPPSSARGLVIIIVLLLLIGALAGWAVLFGPQKNSAPVSVDEPVAEPVAKPLPAPPPKPVEPTALSLTTTNPDSAAVWEGQTNLGSTPLLNAALPAGAHSLRIVDAEGKSHSLSVTLSEGKTETLTLDVATLPLAE